MGCLSHKSVNLPSMIRAAFSKNVYYMFRFFKSLTSAFITCAACDYSKHQHR